MKTIDECLHIIVNDQQFENLFSEYDKRAYKGLIYTIKNHVFFTEGQSLFCLNLIKRTIDQVENIIPNIKEITTYPTWSKSFRIVEIFRKLYIETDTESSEQYICIESNFSNSFKQLISTMSNDISIKTISMGKKYSVSLQENHIVYLIDTLESHSFDISDELLDYYNIIKSWDKSEIYQQFEIQNVDNELKDIIIADIGNDIDLNSLILNDRRLRYQYHIPYKQTQDSLTAVIANRNNTRLWIDSTQYSLSELISSIKQLYRLPILFVFDTLDAKKTTENLYIMHDALVDNNIIDSIGVYFRLKNPVGKSFNEFIHDKKYNSRLDKNSIIAAIETTNLPKFILSSDWTPMSVISIGNNIRSNKTSVYANCCDLIITYSSEQPIIQYN